MKRKYGIIGVILAVALTSIVGCDSKEDSQVSVTVQQGAENVKNQGNAETSQTQVAEKETLDVDDVILEQEASKGEDIDYLTIHGITLDKIYSWVMNGTKDAYIAEGEQIIVDTIEKLGEYANYDLGYAIEDVNNDGIPELVIGQPHQEGIGNMIYAVYTWKNGNFQCNAEGAEYGQIVPERVNETQIIYLSPFAYYEPGMKLETEAETPSMEEAPVCAQWIEDVYLEPNGYDVFTADELEYQRQVVFITISKVSDFKILSLNFESVDENGNVKYATEVLYGQNELKPERPLMVGMSCDSTIPCYGISYMDGNGVIRNFAIEVSGMDGAVLLSEF